MAKEKEKREHVNTKWLLRRISANLAGVDADLREMVVALYLHSNTFLEAEDVRNGSVYFASQASQRQLAAYCHLKTEKSAYSRLVRLQKLGLVDWTTNRSHKSNEYHVQLNISPVVETTDDTDDPFPFTLKNPGAPSASSSVVQRASSVVSDFSSVVSDSSSVVQATGSAFSPKASAENEPASRLQEHSFADNFVETPSVRPGEPGPLTISIPNIPVRVSQSPASPQGTSSPEPPTEASRLETPGIELEVTREIPPPAPVRHKFPKGNDYMAQCSECGLDRIDARGKDAYCTPVGVSQ